jgi:hypothetical protein
MKMEKMRPVETSRNWGRRTKENDGGVNLTVIDCKNLYKHHNVPPVQQ